MDRGVIVPCDTITVSGTKLWLAGCSKKMDLLTMVEHENWLKPAMSLFRDDDLALLVWRRLCTYQFFENVSMVHTAAEGSGRLNDDLERENSIISRYPSSWLPENYWNLPLLNDMAREDQRRGGEWEIKHTIGGGREQTTHRLLVPPGIGAAVHLKENLGMIPVFRYSSEPHTLYRWYHNGVLVFELWVTWEEFSLAERVMPTEFHEERGYVDYIREGRRLEVTKYDTVRIGALNYEGTVDVDSPLLTEGPPGSSFSDSFVITSDDIIEGLPRGVTIQSYAPYGVPILGRERIFQRIASFPGTYIETAIEDLLDIETFSYLFTFESPDGKTPVSDPSFSTTNKRRTKAIFHLGLHSTLPTYETLIKDLEWTIEEVRAHMSQLMFTQAVTVPTHRDPRIHVALWVYVCDLVIIQSPQLTYVYAENFELHSPIRPAVNTSVMPEKEKELLVTIARNLYRSEYGMSLVNVAHPAAMRLLEGGFVQPLPLLDYDSDLPPLDTTNLDSYTTLIDRVFVDGVYGPNKDPDLDYGENRPVGDIVYDEITKNVYRLSEVLYRLHEMRGLNPIDLSEFGFVRGNNAGIPTITLADVSGDETQLRIGRDRSMYYKMFELRTPTRYNPLSTLDEIKDYVNEVVDSDFRSLAVEDSIGVREGYVDNPLNTKEMVNLRQKYTIPEEFPNIVYAMSRRLEINNIWPWKEVSVTNGNLRVVSIPHSATGVITVIKPHKGGILPALALCSVIDAFYTGFWTQLKNMKIDFTEGTSTVVSRFKQFLGELSEKIPFATSFSRAADIAFAMLIENPAKFTVGMFESLMRIVLGNYGATFYTTVRNSDWWTLLIGRLQALIDKFKDFFKTRTAMLVDSALVDSVVKTLCDSDNTSNPHVTQCIYPDIMCNNMDPREANALEDIFMVNSCKVTLASIDNGGKCVKQGIMGLGSKNPRNFTSMLVEYQGELYVLPPNNVSFKVHGKDGIMLEPTVTLFDANTALFKSALVQEYQPLFMDPGFNLTYPPTSAASDDLVQLTKNYLSLKDNGKHRNKNLVNLLKSMFILGEYEGINQVIPNGADAMAEEFFDRAVYKPLLMDANITSIDWGHDVGGLGVVEFKGERRFIYPLMVAKDNGGVLSVIACRQPVVGSASWSYSPRERHVLNGMTFERLLPLLPKDKDVRIVGLNIGTLKAGDMSAPMRLQIEQTRKFVVKDYIIKRTGKITYRTEPSRQGFTEETEF